MTVRGTLQVTTPEGVPLGFVPAGVGPRAVAFFVDLLVLLLLTAPFSLLATWAYQKDLEWGRHVAALVQAILFVGSSFYFAIAELRGRGRTFGKRLLRIRTIDAAGGRLDPSALFIRNLTRFIELFLPLALLGAGLVSFEGSWTILVYVFVAGAWWLYPLVDSRSRRIGDLFGGTIVVRAPRPALLEDLLESAEESAAPVTFANVFTNEELDLYGIRELQTLEHLLRGRGIPAETARSVRRAVLRKMRRSAREVRGGDEQFLRDLYAQLRPRLERHLELGDRRERKKAGRLGDSDSARES